MSNVSSGISERCALALAAAALLISPSALADFGPPAKPKIDCTKPANKNKAACKPQKESMSDDEIYNAAYWMARAGQYRQALVVLAGANNKEDPRILNATGYATRKLGDVNAALPFYRRALEINPNLTVAREYLGEAFLAEGDVVSARAQLSEIETRCGRTCASYAALAGQIASFEQAHAGGG